MQLPRSPISGRTLHAQYFSRAIRFRYGVLLTLQAEDVGSLWYEAERTVVRSGMHAKVVSPLRASDDISLMKGGSICMWRAEHCENL